MRSTEDTVYWPTSPSRFEKQRLAYGQTEAGWFYFAAAGHATDAIPLAQLIAPAIVIAVSANAAAERNYRLSLDDVGAFEKQHGKIAPGSIVLLRTGWSRYWPDAAAYLGDDTPGDASRLRFPGYGAAAARLLVEQRRVALLGIDTASIDYDPSSDFAVHRIAAARNVGGLENLAALDELPATGALLIALPMKDAGGSGGPVRVVALVPK